MQNVELTLCLTLVEFSGIFFGKWNLLDCFFFFKDFFFSSQLGQIRGY